MTCLTITEYPSQMTTDMFVLTTVTRRVSLVWPELLILFFRCVRVLNISASGAETGFQVRGGANLKKLRRAEGGAKMFGVFRVKNHDLTPKKSYFSNCGGRRENIWGISCEKS